MVADRPHGSAVRERLVHGQVEARVGRLETRPVERAAPFGHFRAPARRTTECRPVRPLLEEEQLDARVRRRFERLLPSGSGPRVTSGFLAPARDHRGLVLGLRLLENRSHGVEDIHRSGLRLCRGPAHQRRSNLGRQRVRELRTHLLRADEHDLR